MKNIIEDMKMCYASSLDEAVNMAKRRGKKSMTVIPNGISVIVRDWLLIRPYTRHAGYKVFILNEIDQKRKKWPSKAKFSGATWWVPPSGSTKANILQLPFLTYSESIFWFLPGRMGSGSLLLMGQYFSVGLIQVNDDLASASNCFGRFIFSDDKF